jgi:hypothetical protein
VANAIYDYQKPQNTYTLDQYIACQSDSIACYKNLSFIDRSGHIDYSTWNVASDYVDELRDLCVSVELSDEELAYLEEPYVPHNLAGVMAQNKRQK